MMVKKKVRNKSCSDCALAHADASASYVHCAIRISLELVKYRI